ncbi:MFS transporter [Pararhizobium sp. A13]|uniref:MFS transporter n=1 Tax=Pararhizobium sp. A13 TaxID=3133975 RepID=UPI00311ABDAA
MTYAAIARRSSERQLFFLCVTSGAAGRNAYFVVAAWIAADSSHGPSAVAILLGLGSMAELLTTNLGGALVDRFDRKIICIACDFLRLVLMAASSLGLHYADPLGILFISWVLYAVLDRTYLTSLQALVPSLTERSHLIAFNSLLYIGMQFGNLLAALAAGLLLSMTTREHCFLFALACFALSLSGMLALYTFQVPRAFATPAVHGDCLQQGRALPAILPLGPLRMSALCYALIYAMGMLVSVLGSAFVLQELNGTALQFGYLEAAWAAGSIAGCVLLAIYSACGKGLGIAVHLCLSGIVLAGFLFLPNIILALVQMTILGVSYNVARVLIDAEVQHVVPNRELGRARSQIHTVCVAVGLFVYGLITLLGNAVRPSAVFGFFGLLMLAVALAIILLTLKRGAPVVDRPIST